MSSLSIHSSGPVDTGEELYGRWWRLGGESSAVPGILRVSPSESPRLELFGEMLGADFGSETLLGLTVGGGPVTLVEAYCTQQTGSPADGERDALFRETWSAQQALVGTHASEGAKTLWEWFNFDTSHLAGWAPTKVSHRPLERQETGGRIQAMDIEVPASIVCPLDIGEVRLTWQESGFYGATDRRITITPIFAVRPLRPSTTDDIWNQFVAPLQFLMNVLTGHPNRICQFAVGRDENTRDGPYVHAKVYGTKWSGPAEALALHEYRTRLSDLVDELPRLLAKWMEVYSSSRLALLQFEARAYSESFLEEEFIRLTRAVEWWHRDNVGGLEMKKSAFATMKRKIKEVLTPEEWKLTNTRLAHGEELYFKNRVVETIERAGPPVSSVVEEYVGGISKFADRVGNTRNALTHGHRKEPMTPEEMAFAVHTLSLMFTGLLLRELELEPALRERALRSSDDWGIVNSPTNPFLRPDGVPGDA